MSYIKIKGIVIKEVNTGEADRIVTILTKSRGKISAFAKGAKRTRSSIGPGTQYLCYSDFVLFKGKDMYSVSSCDIIEPFYELRNDLIKLTYGVHLAEIIGDVIQEEQAAPKSLQLFLNTLYFLAKTDREPELMTRTFELRLLSILGYAPYVKSCIACGEKESLTNYFSFSKSGVLCKNCISKDPYAFSMSLGTLKAMQFIVSAETKDIFSFELSQEVLYELSRILRKYIKDKLEKDYTKLDFLRSIALK